ncbi:tagaturonate reductase [Daejeonella sp.]|uniref:tagaturonate reductase n=1 Tax=Daejeonella sp. TaxID=2805397 RepID=UPI0030C149F7
MILNKANLGDIKSSGVQVPDASTFNLPEKVLQFGTGVLLRGLPEYLINKANMAGIFNGRVAVVKSTAKGSTNDFDTQDSLYTIGVRGIENGQKTEENIISSAISRVINAQTAWDDILEIACSEDLEIVISNTTEAGIQLTNDNVHASPPGSFPGKLLSVLYKRYKHFEGDENRGLIILPTELISDNGSVLKEVVFALAKQNDLEESFYAWLDRANNFCNSLVDRIVPGKPDEITLKALEEQLGYRDELLIIAEVYRLWAIEGDKKIKRVLTFEQVDSGVIITPDISMFKELKLRLLNGSHTLTCGIAILAGYDTVHTAMTDDRFSQFITAMLQEDLSRSIPYPVAAQDALQFSGNVLDRFRNPFIKHYWLSISTNFTLKLKMRVVPMLLHYYEKFNSVPEHISFGFAAYLLFMRSGEGAGHFHGASQGRPYQIDDENAGYYSNLWLSAKSSAEVVTNSLSNVQLWDTDLSLLQGFAESVKEHLDLIEETGVIEGMKRINSKNTV